MAHNTREMKPKIQFVMFCKTYSKEISRFENLLISFNKHNKDRLNLFVSVSESEIEQYLKYESRTIHIIKDEDYAGKYFAKDNYWGLSLGYLNQEICKLSFWEKKLAENYLCIDSDLYFIRDFRISDFMYNKKTPYSVLVMDKDLQTEHFYRDFGKWRMSLIKKIFKEVGLKDRRYRTCHGMQVINSKVMRNFKSTFMKKKKYEYKDLVRISPYEFTWYNAWLQKSNVIPVVAVEPFFKTYHMRIEYILAKIKKITEKDLSDQYYGIILNSNWKNKPPERYENPGLISKAIYKILNAL